jgi:AcrR family transcriptional regulator
MSSRPTRREEVLAVAAELFATKGIAGTTVRDIGEATSMLPGSLYHHFRSKDAIVEEVMQHFLADVVRRTRDVAGGAGTDPLERLHGLVRETLALIEHHPHATSIYQYDRQYLDEHGLLDAVQRVADEVRALWIAAIEAAVAQGSLRADLPVEAIYRSMRDTLWGTHRWPTRDAYSVRELSEMLFSLFTEGSGT